ncbi:MAG TPA: hypothetical protein PKZ97_16565 [Azospirillaceae bacterium]|nr:hypothetical protein [Azospirillaceae bacterium]
MSANEKVQAEVAALRRLTMLRLLDDGGGVANSAVIETGLRAYCVPGVDRAAVNADLRFLAAAGLLVGNELRPDLIGVSLTDRGERAARGLERVEGVARPSLD